MQKLCNTHAAVAWKFVDNNVSWCIFFDFRRGFNYDSSRSKSKPLQNYLSRIKSRSLKIYLSKRQNYFLKLIEVEDKGYCNTRYENQIHCAQEWTKFTASTDMCCHIKFIASTDMHIWIHLQFTEQIPCLTSAKADSQTWCRPCNKTFIMTNLRKWLASAETLFKNRFAKLWWVLNIDEHQLKHIYQMLAYLTKLISIPHHIKIYLFTINLSKINKL